MRSLAAALVFTGSCGAAPVAPPPPRVTGTATASVTAPPSSVAPAPTPPREPDAARVFAVPIFGTERSNSVVVSIAVPPAWGIAQGDALGPSFESCASRATLLGTRLTLGARACADGEDGAACVKRMIADQTLEGEDVVDADSSSTRRWVEWARPSKRKGQSLLHEARLYLHDAAAGAVVTCGYAMSQETEKRRSRYKDVCATLALSPTRVKPPAEPDRAPTPDGELGNASEVPNGAALSAAALGFFDAVARNDVKAAEAFILGPDDCPAFAPDKDPAKCRAQMAPTDFEKGFDRMSKDHPRFEHAGAVQLTPLPGGDGAKVTLYLAYILDKANPCAPSEIGVPVVMVGDKARVVMLTKEKN